jgi:hypothetical protein
LLTVANKVETQKRHQKHISNLVRGTIWAILSRFDNRLDLALVRP